MENTKTHFSILAIYIITNVVFWVVSIAIAAAIIIALGLISNLFGNEMSLQMSLPKSLSFIETGQLSLNGSLSEVQLTATSGKISLIEAPYWIKMALGLFIIAFAVPLFYILHTFRTFINNVQKGAFFDLSNISLLKKISFGVLTLWGIIIINSVFRYFFIVRNLEFETINIVAGFRSYYEILLFALLVWVLSHIFEKGVRLQDDTNLTI